jgi:uncharacterized NAD(P)/FAD-binding protein YdhS
MPHGSQDAQPSHCRIAIVGGGFTGSILAAQLLCRDPSLSVTLIESAGVAGRGVAYATSCSWHLLNVPAANMSAFPEDPEHFVRWAQLNYDSGTENESFLPRRVYGQYIESILRQQIQQCPERFQIVCDEAQSIASTNCGATILLAGGRSISAEQVVLALGNFPPASLRLPGLTPESVRYLPWAWSVNALEVADLAQEQNVLLIGSGLTSVDVAIALRMHEFTGTIHILSRHGLLPQGHKNGDLISATWETEFPTSIRKLVRPVRKQIAAAQHRGDDWRCVIDSLRPITSQIWQSLPPAEQRRFLRHVRVYWDVHRHRIAPAINSQIEFEIANGGIQVHAGRITAYYEKQEAAVVCYRQRKTGDLKKLRVGRVINCTGPESDCRKVASPLLQDLLRQGLVRPDALFLGLDAAEDGVLIDVAGSKSDVLYTLGPPLKGRLWESVAVPEIRVQIAELAARLSASNAPTPDILDPTVSEATF